MKYNIAEHWDPTCQITADSDPESEFLIWQKQENKHWSIGELTLLDFEDHINKLKQEQNRLEENNLVN